MEINSLPYEVLDNILKYILDLEDIKTCRLVCLTWYSYFDQHSIRDKENFIFRSSVCSTEELNEVLLNYGGSGVHVHLYSFKLEEIRFEDFGDKIRGLLITDCWICGAQVLANVFIRTPNMIHFYFDEFCRDIGFRGTSKFPAAFEQLRKQNFKNYNLRKFETNDNFSPIRDDLYNIFPNLDTLHLERKRLSTMAKNNMIIKSDLKELSRIQVPMGKDLTTSERNFLMSLPKFKKLEIDWWYVQGNEDSFKLCLEFFTLQTELESLVISFRCQNKKYLIWTYQNTDKEHGSINCHAKNLLFHILKSCKDLKSLHFILHCEDLQFSDAEMQEFTRAISLTKIKKLKFPIIALYCDAFFSHLALLQNLQYIKLHQFFHTNDNQGEKPVFSLDKFYNALLVVLQSNKNLKHLESCPVYLVHNEANVVGAPISPSNEELKINRIYHNRLEHLKLSIQDPNTRPSLIDYLLSWELPKLSTLKISPPGPLSHQFYVANCETKKRFMRWIKKMPLLKIVDLRFIWLDIDDILEICEHLPRLKDIWFENTEPPHKEKLRELFTNFPSVRNLMFVLSQKEKHSSSPRQYTTFTSQFYLVNRQKKVVFIRGDRYWNRMEPFLSL